MVKPAFSRRDWTPLSSRTLGFAAALRAVVNGPNHCLSLPERLKAWLNDCWTTGRSVPRALPAPAARLAASFCSPWLSAARLLWKFKGLAERSERSSRDSMPGKGRRAEVWARVEGARRNRRNTMLNTSYLSEWVGGLPAYPLYREPLFTRTGAARSIL